MRKLIAILLISLLMGCAYGKIRKHKDGSTSAFFLGLGKLTETSIQSDSPIENIINLKRGD